MRVVIRRTGLTPDLLRAWERRYGVVAPTRSEGGQRLYSDADVERLSLLRRATTLGRNIGQIAELDAETLGRLVHDDEEARAIPLPAAAPDLTASVDSILREAMAGVERLDSARVEAVLRQAAITLPVAALTEQVIAPLLTQVGARWHHGTLRPTHEHLASAVCRRVLSWVISQAPAAPDAPGVVVTTPAGQVHEIGGLLAATTAATEGWRVTYLGADLPAEDIAAAATLSRSRAVALSLIYPENDPAVHAELRDLAARLDPGVALLVGGSGAASYRATLDRLGIRVAPDLPRLRLILQQLAAATPAT